MRVSRRTLLAMAMLRDTRVVAFGDSTTAPRAGVEVWSARLPILAAGRGLALRVVNSGVPGDTTERARARLNRDVLAHAPRLVVMQFGINDSAVDVWKDPPAAAPRVTRERFGENLDFFIGQVRSIGAKPLLMTPNPLRWTPRLRSMYGRPPYRPGDPDGMNVLLRDYAGLVRELARARQVPLVDIFTGFERAPDIDGLLLDGMHPNDRGHALIAGLLLNTITGYDLG